MFETLRKCSFYGGADQSRLAVAQKARVSVQLTWRAAEQSCNGLRCQLAGDVPQRDVECRHCIRHRTGTTADMKTVLHWSHQLCPLTRIASNECRADQRGQRGERSRACHMTPTFAPSLDALISEDANEQRIDRGPVHSGKSFWRSAHVERHSNKVSFDSSDLHRYASLM